MYKRISQGWLKHLDFILWDVVALQLAFILAYAIRQTGVFPYGTVLYRSFAIVLIAADFFVAAAFNTMRQVLKRGYYKEAVQTLRHVLLVFAVIVAYLFLTQKGDDYSRITVFLTAVFHFFLGYAIRISWKTILREIGQQTPKTSMILVADEEDVREILERASTTDSVVYRGIVLSNRDGTGEELYGIPVVASLATAADYICREWVDEVFVSPKHLSDIEVSGSAFAQSVEGIINDDYGTFLRTEYEVKDDAEPQQDSVAALIEACRQMAVPVHIRLPLSNIGGKSFVEEVGGSTVLTNVRNYATPLQLAVKRALDIVGGLVGSIIAVVVIAVVGPMIKKESPGPILFKQTRIGKNGKKFQIYKIRSMYMDAEECKAELQQQNRVSDGMMFKLDFDPRIIGNKIVDGKQVTGIGEKIRSGSWDEWPQFFNILMGQMSLVGTRPPTVDEWEKYKYHHRARLATKPGLTGLWQVSGRSRITDFEEVVKLDTEYINNWTIGFDLRILVKTVKVVFKKDGAM